MKYLGPKTNAANLAAQGDLPIAVSSTPPAGASEGDLWLDSDSGRLYCYFDSQWINPASVGRSVSTAAATTITGTNSEGTSNSLARADHNHAIGTAAVGTAQIADGAVTTAKLDSGVAVPTGSVMTYAGSASPTGWLLCDGSEKSVSTYVNLYNAITASGTSFPYGTNTNGSGGAGSSHFRLPDLRGRVPAGKDDMGGTAANRVTSGVSGVTGTTLGAAGGDQSMQSHRHWYDRVTTSGGSVSSIGDIIWAVQGGNVVQRNTGYLRTDTAGDNTGTGSSQNVQPTLILNYIIKT